MTKKRNDKSKFLMIVLLMIQLLMLITCVQVWAIYPVWANFIAFLVVYCVSFSLHFTLTFTQDVNKTKWILNVVKWLIAFVVWLFVHQLLFVLALEMYQINYLWAWSVVTSLLVILIFIVIQLKKKRSPVDKQPLKTSIDNKTLENEVIDTEDITDSK